LPAKQISQIPTERSGEILSESPLAIVTEPFFEVVVRTAVRSVSEAVVAGDMD
jgi:hypothetical protein